MTQKPFPARNSINGCLRGIEGSPSHKMITFWALRCREGGRNSATICCLNLVLNMCPALSLMLGISSLVRASQEDCDQGLALMQLFALVWEDRRCPPRTAPSQAVEGLCGKRLEPTIGLEPLTCRLQLTTLNSFCFFVSNGFPSLR